MSDTNVSKSSGAKKQLGILAMTLLVISAMFGGGVFNVPQNMAQSAALGAIIIAWIVTALGIFFLARTFQVLSNIRPDMTSGIYMYSRAGFGKLVGFLIAWGYWMSAAFGNVGYAVLLMDALNYFFPPYFQGGNTWQAVLVASVVIWGLSIFVLRGVKGASLLNNIGTFAKFVPILLFILIVGYFSFNKNLFSSDFWGNVANAGLHDKPLSGIFDQVKSTMLVTLWMYIGIEGAVVMSDKSDAKTVGKATILGFIITTILFVFVSVIPFGVFSQGELATMAPPSTAAILSSLVGEWGSIVINVGVIIALLSSWLVWTLLVAELPWACAKDGTFPKVFAKTNSKGVASVSLIVSTVIMQAAMIFVYFATDAWNVMLSITGVVILPAYIGSAAYLWKVMATKQYPKAAQYGATSALIVSILATLYGFWLIYAAGVQFIVAGAFIYALGLIVFIWARREHSPQEAIFTKVEWIVAIALVVVAVLAIWMLFSGHLPEVYKP
ncbi:arginine:agmatine antiporter [Ignatzschineria ureiclastica]|uniref:Arginine:agmatine antiporter n=1 Tax=Ignatzschineria ureiclastica TaxID=472582 RepID=A0A2U2AE13_9GAMM|nr:basic amino acid/polyamine antiporter [Ignatzschineria ureiclastica]PWD80902.1 arginine:agmatine antiporter [Ignatzschineria ureiclastica]GGZ94003.1 arginine/agmatine antiporter [Ignatzschineria ureiclastica]